MAINFDPKKSAEKLSGFLQKTSDVGKKALEEAQKSAVAISERAKEDSYQHRLKKYNPMFPEEYTSSEFVLPQLIVLVDEAVRRGIDVCEGAIGWKSVESETEVLHLYSTSTELKEIEFYPAATNGAIYHVDNFNPNRYINVDCIFKKMHEERLAELEQVALMLGAKSCRIEIIESKQEASSLNRSGSLGGKIGAIGKLSVKAEDSSAHATANKLTGTSTSTFEGHDHPQRPNLKWFANHDNINNLIDTRCSNPNAIKARTIKLSGSSSATMTHKAAAAIDGLKGIKGGFSMQSQAMVEHSSELLFAIEF